MLFSPAHLCGGDLRCFQGWVSWAEQPVFLCRVTYSPGERKLNGFKDRPRSRYHISYHTSDAPKFLESDHGIVFVIIRKYTLINALNFSTAGNFGILIRILILHSDVDKSKRRLKWLADSNFHNGLPTTWTRSEHVQLASAFWPQSRLHMPNAFLHKTKFLLNSTRNVLYSWWSSGPRWSQSIIADDIPGSPCSHDGHGRYIQKPGTAQLTS